mgnify:CR=1 FL=1
MCAMELIHPINLVGLDDDASHGDVFTRHGEHLGGRGSIGKKLARRAFFSISLAATKNHFSPSWYHFWIAACVPRLLCHRRIFGA